MLHPVRRQGTQTTLFYLINIPFPLFYCLIRELFLLFSNTTLLDPPSLSVTSVNVIVPYLDQIVTETV